MITSANQNHVSGVLHKQLKWPFVFGSAFLMIALVFLGLYFGGVLTQAYSLSSVRVQGNQIVDQNGDAVQLTGVNRAGTEYACVQGWGIFEGPTSDASIQTMKDWNINVVRVPLNEHCWLGINGVKSEYAGANYQKAVGDYVAALNKAGLAVIVDLHWNAAGSASATDQQVMADADHAPAFWKSVATYFKSNKAVIYDVYNEPHKITWQCWRDGCTTSGGWKAAGMQSLVDAVRSTGSTQPIMVGGMTWANDLSGWLEYMPNDPANQLIASMHLYNFNGCSNTACWDSQVAPVAKKVPIVVGELGENDCGGDFINSFFNWADPKGISYLGWTWNTWDCGSGPSLISSYDGTPTAFGAAFKAHLATLSDKTTPPTQTDPPSDTSSENTADTTSSDTSSTSADSSTSGSSSSGTTSSGSSGAQSVTGNAVSATSIHLSWTAMSGASKYRVQENPQGATVGETTKTTYDVMSISGGTHTYAVYAWVNSQGKEVLVGTTTITAPTPTESTVSTPESTTSTSGGASLSWEAMSGASKYRIQEQPDGKTVADNITGTSYTITSASTGSHTYAIYAWVNSQGKEVLVGTITVVVTTSSTTPSTSSSAAVTATRTNTSTAKLTWTAMSGASKYRVQENPQGITLGNTNGTTFTVTSVSSGTHTYAIYAWVNSQGKEVLVGTATLQ